MSKAKNPPWLMWGSSQVLTLSTFPGPGNIGVPQQLAAIDYGRPDSWTFFFQAQVLARTASIVDPNTVQIVFDLVIGVGRSTIILPAFESYSFVNIVANPGQVKYSQSVNGPPRFAGDLGPNNIDTFSAQTIQCNARILIDSGAAPGRFDVAASVNFAPRTHVRPDWYGKDALGGAER